MNTIPLYAMAHARSGDKGDGSNVGILAYDERGYEILREQLTAERVKQHFGEIVRGEVVRRHAESRRRSATGNRQVQLDPATAG